MENLSDPLGDRVMKNVPPIARDPLTREELFGSETPKATGSTPGDLPNMLTLRKHLLREGHINKPELMELIQRSTKIMREEPNVIRIKEPVIIVGDIHGQFYDLIHMFEKVVDSRPLPKTNMLFLGDYVDRGSYSIEVCIFLLSLKICFPKEVTMLRGNHESVAMTEHFTFREEVLRKYDNDESVFDAFIEAFESMPIAADVNNDYLCMHGGISPELTTVEDINKIDRFVEPPLQGFLCDLLWSDPCSDKEARNHKFSKNLERECSWKFGLDPVKQILKKNNFLSIIRAHQVQIDGYKMHRWGGASAFPSVITVFSAPNYCGSYKNKGAVILIEDDKMNIKQYKDVEQPFSLPNGLDLFSWSLPFLADKIGDMLDHLFSKNSLVGKSQLNVVKQSSDVDFEKIMSQLQEEKKEQDSQKIAKIKAKVMTIARFNRMLKNVKENSEILTKAKKISGDGKLPQNILLKASEEIKSDVSLFLAVRKMDSEHEKMPSAKKVVEAVQRRQSLKDVPVRNTSNSLTKPSMNNNQKANVNMDDLREKKEKATYEAEEKASKAKKDPKKK